MTDTPRTQLERAYRLIQQERGNEAIDVLRPVLAKDPNNADAWWLMANAVDEPEDAREALENVLRITPNHVEARNLLDQLNAASTATGFEDDDFDNFFASPVARAADVVPVADTLDKSFDSPFDTDNMPSFVGADEAGTKRRDFTTNGEDDFPEFGDFGTSRAPANSVNALKSSTATPMARRRTSPVLLLLLALLLIVIIGGVFVILNQNKTAIAPTINVTTGTTANVAVSGTGSSTVQSTLLALVPTGATSAATSTALKITATSIPTFVTLTSVATSSAALNSSPVVAVTQAATFATSPVSVTSIATISVATTSDTTAGTATVGTPTAGDSNAALNTAIQHTGDQFHAAGMSDAEVVVGTSSFGQTLTVRFCSKAGPTLVNTVDTAMDTLAAQGATVSDAIQAISVEVTGCTTSNSQLLYKAVASIQDVTAYLAKTLSIHQFRATWKQN